MNDLLDFCVELMNHGNMNPLINIWLFKLSILLVFILEILCLYTFIRFILYFSYRLNWGDICKKKKLNFLKLCFFFLIVLEHFLIMFITDLVCDIKVVVMKFGHAIVFSLVLLCWIWCHLPVIWMVFQLFSWYYVNIN